MDNGDTTRIIVQADKTVLKLGGLSVKGLNTSELERILSEKLKGLVRVIGVTGNSVDMDVYGVDESAIERDADDIIKAVALAEGITLTDLAQVVSSKKIVSVELGDIPERDETACAGERWMRKC